MMKVTANAMRLQALRALSGFVTSRLGEVTSYDPNKYAVKVTLQPDDTKTGWLPVASPWIGNGWGLFAPPSVGNIVEVHFLEGALDAGIAELRLFNNVDLPLAVQSGEFWLVHETGSCIKFHNDGSVDFDANTVLNLTVGGNLNATVGGDLSASITGDADFTVDGDATADISGTLGVTAETATITAATTTVNGVFVVNGATELNGSITQGAGSGGSTNASLIGPVAVTNDVTAGGISLKNHPHPVPGVQTGTSTVVTGAPT